MDNSEFFDASILGSEDLERKENPFAHKDKDHDHDHNSNPNPNPNGDLNPNPASN